jgi:uncharacterized protein YdaT
MGKNQHVVKSKGQWVVKQEGNKQPRSSHRTQTNAIKAAIPFAKKQKAEVVIHRADGTIRDRDSYGDESKKKDRKH